MDPLSHAALGAALAEPAAHARHVVAAVAVAAVGALAPDADVLIRSSADPLLTLEYHRHFTHALVFTPVGAVLGALLLYPISRRWLKFRDCVLYAWLGFLSHALLDACTSYGVLLFWPFSSERVALDLVSAVDPLLTLPLLGFAVYGVLSRRTGFAVIGVAWALVYLGLGVVQHARAERAARDLAMARGHAPVQIAAKPSFGNTLLWRTIYEADGIFHIDAVRTGFETVVFDGVTLPKLDVAREFPWLAPDTEQWQDVERFARFTSGYLAVDPENGNRIVDIRYSLVPNRADAFWGIELNAATGPDEHAAYVTMRIRSSAEGRELLRMLFQGDPVE
jgi:inner membrane protein